MLSNERIIKFLRLRLGLKPIIDYAQARGRLLGVADLPIRTVFDVGANVGKKARRYRTLFPDARIYCFEPVPQTFERLNSWAARQKGRVRAFNLALGSSPGRTDMTWNLAHPGGSTLQIGTKPTKDENHRQIAVDVTTLDLIASTLDIEDEILVKIDVEGHDMEVIRGGMRLLERAAAVIVEVRIFESPCAQPGFPEFIRVMTDLGYMYRGNLACGYVDGLARIMDVVFIRPIDGRQRRSAQAPQRADCLV